MRPIVFILLFLEDDAEAVQVEQRRLARSRKWGKKDGDVCIDNQFSPAKLVQY